MCAVLFCFDFPRTISALGVITQNQPEKAIAPHSSTLAWKIPWTEEPERLQSMGLQRVATVHGVTKSHLCMALVRCFPLAETSGR